MRVEHFRKATLYCGDCREILPELAGVKFSIYSLAVKVESGL